MCGSNLHEIMLSQETIIFNLIYSCIKCVHIKITLEYKKTKTITTVFLKEKPTLLLLYSDK